MTEVPKSVQIGPYTYEIILDSKKLDEIKLKENDGDLCGYVNHKKQKITIDPKQGPDMLADTLLHEMFHAILSSGFPDEELSNEERIVGVLATTTLDTLRRNPKVTEFILNGSVSGGSNST